MSRKPDTIAAMTMAIAMAVLASACGGPERPFELGLKEVPSDLLLGRQTKPALPLPAQLPPMTFLFTEAPRPAATTIDVPPPLPEPPPPVEPCPEADPLVPVRLPIEREVLRPPSAASYAYRTTGVVFGAPLGGQPRRLRPTTQHDVGNVQYSGPGDFTFDVTAHDDDRRTTTTYHVVPRSSLAVAPGLYIARVESDGAPAFEPKPELMLLPFPALQGTAYNAAGSDGVTTIRYDGRVDKVERLDLCGTNVDAYRVEIVNGVATHAAGDQTITETFGATYHVAPQYGGLLVVEKVGADVAPLLTARTIESRILSEPRDPVA